MSISPADRLFHGRTLQSDAGGIFVIAAGGVLAVGIAVAGWADFNGGFVVFSSLCFVTIALLAMHGLAEHPHPRFGLANIITTVRAAATSLTGGLIFEIECLTSEERGHLLLDFVPAGIVLLLLCLDGLDGFAARRRHQSSDFGARYDMEVDALLILFLSVLVFMLGKVGVFVLAIGMARYAFALAQALTARLRGTLAPSFRRKAVCVLQGACLCIILTPVLGRPAADGLALVALAALAASFGIDIARLLRIGKVAPA